MSDLIRSLRKASRLLTKNVDSYIKVEETLPHQAADLIEQQQARIDGLEQELKIARRTAGIFNTRADELAATVERLSIAGADMAKARGTKELRDRVNEWDEALAAAPHISLNALKRDVENNLLDMMIRHFSEDEETWTSKELQSELMEIQRLRNML